MLPADCMLAIALSLCLMNMICTRLAWRADMHSDWPYEGILMMCLRCQLITEESKTALQSWPSETAFTPHSLTRSMAQLQNVT